MSVSVETAVPGDRERWSAFCESAAGHELGHAWDYLELLTTVFGLEVVRFVARRDAEWVGVLPLVVQRSLLGTFVTSVPYVNYAGVLGAEPEARTALARAALELASRRRADRLELRGRHGEDLPIDAWHGKCCYVLELPDDAEALWRALGSKLRAQIRRPSKAGYAARAAGADDLPRFYPLLARRWHELGSPILPRRFFEALLSSLADRAELLLVEKDGAVAAAGLIVQSGDTVEIPWAASAVEHNRFGVNMQLYWTALERALARDARRFDFGRSTPGTGNARFKLQWTAREVPLHWNVHASSRKGRSSERGTGGRGLAAALWRRMPGFVARKVGPRLAARIPL